MLKFDPNERISVDEALKHPFFEDLYDDSIDVNQFLEDKVTLADFDFELYDLTTAEYKQLIYEECLLSYEENLREYLKSKVENPNGLLRNRFD